MGFPEPFYRWRPHPWHGLETGPDAPEIVTAFIEITPFDFVKYEVEKRTGIPGAFIESDLVDPRYFSAANIKNRIESYLQMLAARAGAA